MTLPLRHGSLPARYRANKEKNHGHRKGFLKATAMQKAHIASACKNPLLRLTGKQQAEYSMQHENLSARFACWRQNKTSGGWYPWPDGAGQHYITGIIHPALTRLHGVPCCIILRYVKSGFGGPPYLWRPLHAAQYGAGQSLSHAPQATRAA